MATWVDRCETLWIDASVAAVLVTGFTALAMIQCRQPVRRRAWGRLGITSSLLLIPLVWLGPLPRIVLRHPTSFTRPSELHGEVIGQLIPGAAGTAPDHGAVRDRSIDLVVESRLTWKMAAWRSVLALYGCGLLVGLGRLSLGVIASSLLIRRALEPSERAKTMLASLPYASKTQPRPCVRVSKRVGRPVLVGFWRPAILIPPELDHPATEAKLRLGLLHELAHAEVGDSRFGALANAAQAVWFFLPQVWWVQSQLRLDAEFLADHRAVSNFGTSFQYAESLVGLSLNSAEVDSRAVPLPSLATSQANLGDPPRPEGFASALLQRVQMLLKCPFEVEDVVSRGWIIAATLFMLIWTLAASCLTVQDRRKPLEQLSWRNGDEAGYALQSKMLEIDSQLQESRLFNLQFRLPARFQLVCEVLADLSELAKMEIIGYRLGPTQTSNPPSESQGKKLWRRIEIDRVASGRETVRVDGSLINPSRPPTHPETWLTIRPIPGRKTRIRNLELTW